MTLDPVSVTSIAGVGLAAGILGGLLGIGGSVIMIPALALIFHRIDAQSQHLYQAAAMTANVAVSAPAAIEHLKRGALHKQLFAWVLAAALIAIVIGVLVSDQLNGLVLRRIFAIFLIYVAFTTAFHIARKAPEKLPEHERVTPIRASTVGGIMGFAAGLLGIGGGVLTVPLTQTLCHVPLKKCIAVSAATMCITATAGATLKLSTLHTHGYSAYQGLAIALLLAPTAVIGGALGARLTHKLPLPAIRTVFTLLLLIAAWRMATPAS